MSNGNATTMKRVIFTLRADTERELKTLENKLGALPDNVILSFKEDYELQIKPIFPSMSFLAFLAKVL
jgi:hypothetical protein